MDKELIDELYQSLILDHSRHPRNFGTLQCIHHAKGKNPSCGDQLELFLELDQNNIVQNVKFNGEGCALSMSSASLMTQAIKGKTVIEVKNLLQQFIDFIIDEEKTLDDQYEPLHIYSSVHNFPLRVKCVLLPWRTLEHIVNQKHDTATSEE